MAPRGVPPAPGHLAFAVLAALAAAPGTARALDASPPSSRTYAYTLVHALPPAAVVESARVHLAGWIGPDVARKQATLDSAGTTYLAPSATAAEAEERVTALASTPARWFATPGWHVAFRMSVPGAPCAGRPLVVHVDSTGALTGISSAGLSDTPEDPCVFSVGRDQAMGIARAHELADGVKPWDVQFGWVPRFRKIAWTLTNTIEEAGGCSANGEIYVIDAKTGEILGRSSWSKGC